jgi:hypothetical protein
MRRGSVGRDAGNGGAVETVSQAQTRFAKRSDIEAL